MKLFFRVLFFFWFWRVLSECVPLATNEDTTSPNAPSLTIDPWPRESLPSPFHSIPRFSAFLRFFLVSFFLSFFSKRNSRSQTLLFREWKNLGIWEKKKRFDHGDLRVSFRYREDWKEQFVYVRKDGKDLKQRRESSSTVFLDYYNDSLFSSSSSSFKYKL